MDDLAIAPTNTSAPEHGEISASEHHAAPKQVADSGSIPKGAKYDPRWTAMAEGPIRESAAPSTVQLPDQIVRGLDEAWDRSQNANHDERGGNIIRSAWGGEYDFRHGGKRDEADRDSWMPDRSDVRTGQEFLGTYHTHDATHDKEPYDSVGFSDADVGNLATMEDRVKLLRSGSMTYMLARTKEFDELAKQHSSPEAEQAFRADMVKYFNAAYDEVEQGDPSKHVQALEAATQAAAQQYHLLYYQGEGAKLRRAGAPPPKQ
jgi:hypothetical protein